MDVTYVEFMALKKSVSNTHSYHIYYYSVFSPVTWNMKRTCSYSEIRERLQALYILKYFPKIRITKKVY